MQSKISTLIAQETAGNSFKTYKYCFEKVNVPTVVYDDIKEISFKKYGETESFKGYKNLTDKAKKLTKFPPRFKFFLDGSRRTYKVDDVAYNNRIYPIVAGQIGVGCCERINPDNFKIKKICKSLVISLPECADKDGKGTLFFNSLIKKINVHPTLVSRKIQFEKILAYEDRGNTEKYENKAIATIQDEMVDSEKRIVVELVKAKALNEDSYLIKDGSLEYGNVATGDYKDLSIIKSNFRRVVGVSKSFNPEKCLDEKGKSNATSIANLPLNCRTSVYMYQTDFVGSVNFGIWYIRIRDANYSSSPFSGIVKIQKILVTDQENNEGLDTEEVDSITANIINEKNPVCYGSDDRWANHLYPVYLTEKYVKSLYLSDSYYLNLF